MRVNHTYGRDGALAYSAAYDVHHARVIGRTEARAGIDPFSPPDGDAPMRLGRTSRA
ncbi:hypothetical protein ACWGIV_29855 [Streptomyces sp. NPDC054844]